VSLLSLTLPPALSLTLSLALQRTVPLSLALHLFRLIVIPAEDWRSLIRDWKLRAPT